MVTPFDARRGLDEDAAARLMHHLLENGSDGLVLAGSTGEAATLTDDEKARLWELGVEECGDAPVIAGTGTYDTRHTVELTERATEIGVDAVLVVTPYYVRPNRRGIKAHFEAAAAATDRPVIALQHPRAARSTDMPNDLLAELAQIDNVAAVKQARYDDWRRSTAWTCWPATTTSSRRRWTWAGPAGFWWRRTWSGARCAA